MSRAPTTQTPTDRKWKIALVIAIVTGPLLGVLGNAWAAQTFPDVPPNHTFYKEVEWGAQHGIINGFNDGTFRPGQNVTRGAAAAFLSHYNDAIHTVTSSSDPPASTAFSQAALCPVGERAIGGAGYQSTVDLFVTDTYLSGREFVVRWETDNNQSSNPVSVRATAVCAPDVAANTPLAAPEPPPTKPEG